MRKSLEQDVVDAGDALESILKKLSKMTMTEKVDVAARLKAVMKNCEDFDKSVKEDFKKFLKDGEGTVPGMVFKAVYKISPVSRLDQKALKEAEPKLVEEFTKTKPEGRFTFEAR